MSKFSQVWIVCSIWHIEDGAEFTISQEGYSRLEQAQAFCETRHNGQVYDLDPFTYVSEPDKKQRYYEYKILNITVK